MVAGVGFEQNRGYLLFGGAYTPNYAVCRHCGVGHRPRRTRRYARVLGSESEGRVALNPTKTPATKEKTRYTKWCSEFLWLREWDLNLTTFGL